MDRNLLVKEYEFINDKFNVKGKIYEVITSSTLKKDVKYKWEISHYCQINNDVSVYIPGAPYGSSIANVEKSLFVYADRFDQTVVSTKDNLSF